MIKKYISIITILMMALSFTSCIDLVEEVTVKKDLSGHYEMRLETSGFGDLMNQMGSNISIPQLKELDEKMRVLSVQPGISHLKKNIKVNEMQFNISFDFENEKALNNAMYQLAGIEPNMFVKKFLRIKKHKIIRPNLNPHLQRIIEDQDLLKQLPSTDLLTYVNYKFIINSAREIKEASNPKAIIQSDKKTLISSYSFKDLIIDKKDIYLKIRM
jgi:hypothetical protein